jgi:hypothetical protein
VVAIVISKRRSASTGEAAPAATEVAGAVSPAVGDATPAAVEGTPSVPTGPADEADRATITERRE